MAAELSDSLLASQPAVGRPRCTALQLGLSALVLLLSAAFVLIFVVAPGSQLTGPDGQGCIDHITLLCDWDIGMQFAGVLVAKDRGFYSDAGLCVDLNADPATEDSVVERVQKSDGIAVGISEGAMLLEALSNQEAELVAMASVLPTSPLGWMSLHNSSASVSDRLNGASIAVHPDGVLPLSVALSSHGLTLSSVNVVRASDTLEPLINGSVDLMQGYLMDEFITLRQLYPNASIILAVDNGDVSYSQVLFIAHPPLSRAQVALTKPLETDLEPVPQRGSVRRSSSRQ